MMEGYQVSHLSILRLISEVVNTFSVSHQFWLTLAMTVLLSLVSNTTELVLKCAIILKLLACFFFKIPCLHSCEPALF
jgi:hypothetical protein